MLARNNYLSCDLPGASMQYTLMCTPNDRQTEKVGKEADTTGKNGYY